MSSVEEPDVYSPDVCPGGDVDDLPPSAKLVRLALAYEAPLTQQGIADVTGLCDRTVRYGLQRLDDAGVLRSRPNTRDARQDTYRLADGAQDGDAR